MIWSTKLIEKLASEIKTGRKLKSILRDISIDSILSEDNNNPVFPFYLNKDGSTLDSLIRGSNILFNYTEEEEKKIIEYKKDPIKLFNDIYRNFILDIKRDLLNCYIDVIQNNRFNIMLLPINFDSGSSYGIIRPLLFMAFHYICFNHNRTLLVCSDDRIGESIIILNHLIQNIPFFISPGIISITNKKFYMKVKFDNGCRLIVTNSTMGTNYDYVILDKNIQIVNNLVTSSSRVDTQIHILTKDKDFFNSKMNSNFVTTDLTPKIRDVIIDDIILE